MSRLSPEEIQRLVDRIVLRTRPKKVVVFGSYAKGAATSDSDLDIMLVQDTDLPMARRADDLAPLLSSGWISVDVHVYTPDEVEEYAKDRFSFVSSALASGKTAFEA